MNNIDILDLINGYRTISIVGMDKNAGKTTVLNHILSKARGKYALGLTSIGRDGEETDRVTKTEKPKIYVEKGTVIATAKECLYKGDITREIIRTTGIHTAMGEVVISRALSDGYVELAGPSINSYMSMVCKELLSLGCNLIIVDGALSRKTSASPAITEGVILSTGASLSGNLNKVVEMTSHTVRLLSLLKEENEEIIKICDNELKDCRGAIINKDRSFKILDMETAIDAGKTISESLKGDFEYIFIRGIISKKLIEDIMKSTEKYKGATFLVEDGTKLFVDRDTLYKFEKQGGKIRVINNINLLCVTCNPKSPYGYGFDRYEFIDRLRQSIAVPVIDVVGGD